MIGSDDFLGEAVWTWEELQEDAKLNMHNHRKSEKQLQARPGKKDRVSGSVFIKYSYISRATWKRLEVFFFSPF
jgi:hypothetical protein